MTTGRSSYKHISIFQELRNQWAFAIIILNLILIVAIITCRNQKDLLSLSWPYNHIQVDTNLIEINEKLEPIGTIFLLLFLLGKNIKFNNVFITIMYFIGIFLIQSDSLHSSSNTVAWYAYASL